MSKPADVGRALTSDEFYDELETSDGKPKLLHPGKEERTSAPLTSRNYYVNTDKIKDMRETLEKKGKLPKNEWIKVKPTDGGQFDAGNGIEFNYGGEVKVRVYAPNVYLADKPLLPKLPPSRAPSPERPKPAPRNVVSQRGNPDTGDDFFGGRRRKTRRLKRKHRKTRGRRH